MMLKPEPFLGARADLDIGGTRLRERDDLALVSMAIPRQMEADAEAAAQDAFGMGLPGPRISAVQGHWRLVRTGPDQVFVLFPHAAPDAARVVREAMGQTVYVTDQTDGWLRLELAGPLSRPALARICPMDLDPVAFPVDAAARTVIEHLGAFVIRTGEESYLLLSPSSSAGSFLEAIETSLRNVAP